MACCIHLRGAGSQAVNHSYETHTLGGVAHAQNNNPPAQSHLSSAIERCWKQLEGNLQKIGWEALTNHKSIFFTAAILVVWFYVHRLNNFNVDECIH
uniref:Uncharacterized protein n=1 Tax=Nelumbo nucifera TaxID=4432 RepID=A0A822XLR8_NELNU|nr:TPA_asm: hypothetical protein HUJ06_022680 [Nelumbo nucifera]